MATTNLQTKSKTRAGKEISRDYSFINSTVSNAALQTFTEKIGNMTTNVLVEANRIDKRNVNEADSPVTPAVPAETSKTQPTLSIGNWTKTETTYSATITYNGDGSLSTTTGTITGNILTYEDEDEAGSFSGVITASEGTNYAAAQLAFSCFYSEADPLIDEDPPIDEDPIEITNQSENSATFYVPKLPDRELAVFVDGHLLSTGEVAEAALGDDDNLAFTFEYSVIVIDKATSVCAYVTNETGD